MPYIKYQSQDGSKPAFKLGVNIFLRMLAAGFMCLIVFVSMNSIFLAFGSEITGYTLQEKNESGTFETVDKVVFEGEDKTLPKVDEKTQRIIPTTQMTASAKKWCGIASQTIMFLLFCVLLYTEIWSCGDSDCNLVRFGKLDPPKFKGAVAGAYASIPYLVFWIVLCLSNFNLIPLKMNSTFAFANAPFKPFIDYVLDGGFAWYDSLLLLIPAALIVIYCQLAYTIGYKQILISEKILYTNK